jgi:hypothetical protein
MYFGIQHAKRETSLECLCGSAIVLMIGWLILLINIGKNQLTGPAKVANYEVEIARIEAASNNPQLTLDERANAISSATKINKEIGTTKAYRKSLWFGWFFYAPYGDLKLADMSRIKPVNQNFTGNLSVDLIK